MLALSGGQRGRNWSRVGVACFVAAACILATTLVAITLFDVRSGSFQPDDCGRVSQFCPHVISDQFESAETCEELEDLLLTQLGNNRYYSFDPYGRELTWHEVAGQRAEFLECAAVYQ